jgi:hypothetical protein
VVEPNLIALDSDGLWHEVLQQSALLQIALETAPNILVSAATPHGYRFVVPHDHAVE